MGKIVDLTKLSTAREHAQAWTSSKSATAKKEILAQVIAKSKTSRRMRWGNLAKAMAENDVLRVTAYTCVGKAKSAAWKAVKAAEPKAAKPKVKAKAKAKAKVQPKAEHQDMTALAEQIASMDEVAQAAFLTAFTKARK